MRLRRCERSAATSEKAQLRERGVSTGFALRGQPARVRAALRAPALRLAVFFFVAAPRLIAPTSRATFFRAAPALRFVPATFREVLRFAAATFRVALRFAAPTSRFAVRFAAAAFFRALRFAAPFVAAWLRLLVAIGSPG
jgi:hypothetical protein